MLDRRASFTIYLSKAVSEFSKLHLCSTMPSLADRIHSPKSPGGNPMHTPRRRALRRTATILAVTGLLAVPLAGCAAGDDTAGPSEEIPAGGVDDGSTLTLWTRAPI